MLYKTVESFCNHLQEDFKLFKQCTLPKEWSPRKNAVLEINLWGNFLNRPDGFRTYTVINDYKAFKCIDDTSFYNGNIDYRCKEK